MTKARLFHHITDTRTLWGAFRRIRQKRAHSDIDAETIRAFEQQLGRHLRELSDALRESRYVPEPSRRVRFPKPGKPGELRTIALAALQDKIVQEAVRSAIEPMFNPLFLDCSFAYRPNLGAHRAVEQVERHIQSDLPWAAICDIDNFFDSIDHGMLLKRVRERVWEPEVLRLIELWLKMGVVYRGRWVEVEAGVPQGSIISPLLSNIYLHPFDQEMTRADYSLVRYGDDCVVLSHDREAAVQALKDATGILRQLHLVLNPNANPIAHVNAGFVFLGFLFKGDKRTLAPDKLQQMQRDLRDLLTETDDDIIHLVNDLNLILSGWQRYYGTGDVRAQFAFLDSVLVDQMAGLLERMRTARVVKNVRDARPALQRIHWLTEQDFDGQERLVNRVFERLKQKQSAVSQPSRIEDRGSRIEVSSQQSADRSEYQLQPAPSAVSGQQPEAGDQRSAVRSQKSEVGSQKAEGESAIRDSQSAIEESPIARPQSAIRPVAKAIALKRRQVEKQLSADAELVVTQRGSFIGKTQRRIVVRQQGKTVKEIPFFRLKTITVTSDGISLSTDLIRHCADEGIPIHFIGYDGRPHASLVAPRFPLFTLSKAQADAARTARGLRLAAAFVEGKIRNQINLIKYYAKTRRTKDAQFVAQCDGAISKMQALLDGIDPLLADPDVEQAHARLFAVEGNSATHYWGLIKTLLGTDVYFEGRHRRGATDLVNSLLNYGYGILYGRVYEAVIMAGLNPNVSFLHAEHVGKPTLIFDLVEEFRQPLVDKAIIAMIRRKEDLRMEGTSLSRETRGKVIDAVHERLATRVRYRSRRVPMREIIHQQVRLLVMALQGKGRYRPFIDQW